MAGDPGNIAYLWQQFIAKKASPQELDELFSLLQEEENAAVSNELLENEFKRPAKGEWDKEYWLSKLSEIKKAPVITPVRKLMPWRWVAVASIITLVILGAYFTLFNNPKTSESKIKEIVKSTDVKAPKNNRATITLADGKKIYLDSAGNGTLAQQGSVQLAKVGDGRITYNLELTTHNAQLTTYNTLTNPRGSKVIGITLSDGSRVWLNAESSVRYPVAFNGNERKVEITGEAYFEVAHDKSKPFIVSKGNMNVHVLGTHFNVNAYDDEEAIRVTLLEGSVKLSSLTTHTSKLIKPGQQATFTPDSRLTTHDNIDVDEILAWKNDKFIFSGTGIQSVMRQLARWYDVDVQYQGEIPKDEFVGVITRSRNGNISTVLDVLQKTKTVSFEISNKTIIVKPYVN